MKDGFRPRILLVDDEVEVLDGLRRILRFDFEVTIATGAEEALKLVASEGPYEVVVSDLRMPGVDGINLLAGIRKAAPRSVRILLTGYGDVEAAIAAVNQGHVFRFLTKPCPRWILLRALHDSVKEYGLDTANHTARG